MGWKKRSWKSSVKMLTFSVVKTLNSLGFSFSVFKILAYYLDTREHTPIDFRTLVLEPFIRY